MKKHKFDTKREVCTECGLSKVAVEYFSVERKVRSYAYGGPATSVLPPASSWLKCKGKMS